MPSILICGTTTLSQSDSAVHADRLGASAATSARRRRPGVFRAVAVFFQFGGQFTTSFQRPRGARISRSTGQYLPAVRCS
jgi:hypothetical protein